jgi:hypothetical protein
MTVKELKTNNMGYTPYKMKGHTLKGIKQRGVPFSGGVGSNEMESGVADTINASPNKGLWDSIKNIGKKVKEGVGGALGLGGGDGTGGGGKIKAMDDRISALEQGSGGDATASAMQPKTNMLPPELGGGPQAHLYNPIMASGDPMLAGAGMSGNIMEMMKKRKEAKQASWGGVGMEGAGV